MRMLLPAETATCVTLTETKQKVNPKTENMKEKEKVNPLLELSALVLLILQPVVLMVCGWNVLAPECWCWLPRAYAASAGAIATLLVLLIADGKTRNKNENGENAPKNAQGAKTAQDMPKGTKPPANPLPNSAKGHLLRLDGLSMPTPTQKT